MTITITITIINISITISSISTIGTFSTIIVVGRRCLRAGAPLGQRRGSLLLLLSIYIYIYIYVQHILHTRYHEKGNPLENATDNPLDMSSEHRLEK